MTQKNSPKPVEYVAIRMWHQETGSYDGYIRALQLEAHNEHAPPDAIFKRHGTNEWVTVAQLAADHPFRLRYERLQEQENKHGN